MGRQCYECGAWLENWDFSANQRRKGALAKCVSCVAEKQQPVTCPHCYGTFSSQNALDMHLQKCRPTCTICQRSFSQRHDLDQHMKTHRPKNVSCPVCGAQRFGSGADAVAHVESGYCTGCRGADNARRQIYDFTRQKAPQFIADLPMIEDGYGGSYVPDEPYKCACGRSFRNLSAMMAHQADSTRCTVGQRQMIGW